jgi:hypothetical protein
MKKNSKMQRKILHMQLLFLSTLFKIEGTVINIEGFTQNFFVFLTKTYICHEKPSFHDFF